jgi:small multidrug resistance pump
MKIRLVMNWLVLLPCIAFNGVAGLFIKLGTQPTFRLPSIQDPMAIITNWPMLLAVACYASAFLAYAAALTRLPLSVVNPIVTSGTTVMVAIIGFTLFREPMRATTCIGIATVIFGVLLITRN